jgi:hypothetical protein
MSPMVNRAERHMEGNGLAVSLPGLIGEARKPGQPDGNLVAGEWLLPLIGNAIDRCMSRKEAAILLNLSEPELSKQIAGVDGKSLNVRRLGALGEAVLVALIDELRIYLKLDDPAARVTQALELVNRGMTLLIAEVKK